MEKPCRRRKIEFIEDSMARRRSVTFVKRRGGLFRKASELGVLCGAQCAIITFSERGTPFVFGHPSADAVIDRFVRRGHVDYGHRIQSEAVGISKKKRNLNNNNNNSVECWRRRFWWDDDKLIDGMEKVEELELYTSKVRELRKKVRTRMEEITAPAPRIDNHDATTLIQNPILTSENNDDCFSPGNEDHEHESPETISNNSSSLMVTSSSCCTGISSSSSDGDDNNDIFECLDELVPSKSVVSCSSSGDGDFWQMMMMMERHQEEENQMMIKGRDITATYI